MAALILYVVLVFRLGCICAQEDFFAENPLDVTVQVGEIARFWCSTDDDFTCNNMNWVYSNSLIEDHPIGTIGTCRTPRLLNASDPGRLSMTFDTDASRYGLEIRAVVKSDSGRYGCWVTRPETADEGLINEYSEVAFLTVTPSLRPIQPTCRTRPDIVSLNQAVYFICEVPQDAKDEYVRLTWYFEKNMFRRSLSVERGSTHSEPYRLRERDNYGRFTCIAGADDIGGPSCTLVPVQIPTNVTLRLDSSDIITDHSGDATATFDCDAEAVPPVTSYEWRVAEYNATTNKWTSIALGDKHQLTNGDRTLVTSTSKGDWDGLWVTCTASNDIGLSEISQPVTIHRCSDGALVTDFSHCDNVQTTVPMSSDATMTDTDAKTSGGDTQSEDMNAGATVGIVVGITVLLIIIVLLLGVLVLRSRRSKKAAANGVGSGPGVSYKASDDTVGIGHQTDAFQSNALMVEAEASVANACTSDESSEWRGLDHIKVMPGDPHNENSARNFDGGMAGQDYASIGKESGRQTVTRHDGEMYASIGEAKVNAVLPPPQSNIAGYESVEQKTTPNAYESVDLNVPAIQTSSQSSKETSDAGQPLKKVCVVSPTIHAGSDTDQVVYAMPDKSRKKKSERSSSESKKTPVFHKSVKSASSAGVPADVIYALPDKTPQRSIQKYNSVPAGSETPTGLKTPSQPPDSSEVLYAMPDKSCGRHGISRSLSSDAVLDFDSMAAAESGSLTDTGSLKIKSRHHTSPRKPQRTPSSRLAGSRVLRGKTDTESKLARSYSAGNLEKKDFSDMYAKPDKSGTRSSKTTEPGPSASAPVYATPDKELKIPSQNMKKKNATTSNNNEPVYAVAE